MTAGDFIIVRGDGMGLTAPQGPAIVQRESRGQAVGMTPGGDPTQSSRVIDHGQAAREVREQRLRAPGDDGIGILVGQAGQ